MTDAVRPSQPVAKHLGWSGLGPFLDVVVVAFAVAASELSLLGLGPAFWALVVGTGASLLLEGEAVRALRGHRPAAS